jgi:DNA gyrase subunit B
MPVETEEYGPYDASSIEVLHGLEPIRRRPGMYIGDVRDGSGLQHLVWEVVANCLDQHLMRRARRLEVSIEGPWVTVADDGDGIPIEPHPTGAPAVEVVFTTLHAGATFDGHFPHVHVGLHGVGVAAVAALSTRLEVETIREGRRHRMALERGVVVEPLVCAGPTGRRGTRIRFHPDPSIFTSIELDRAAVRARLETIAYLHPLLEVRFQGEVLEGHGGPARWVRAIAGPELACPSVFAITRTIDDVFVDLAIGWRASGPPDVRSFVNVSPTRGGTHVRGLWRGLSRVAGRRIHVVRELLEPGLVAVLHVGLFEPRFGAPTRDQLLTPLAGWVVRRAIVDAFPFAERAAPLRALFAERLGTA